MKLELKSALARHSNDTGQQFLINCTMLAFFYYLRKHSFSKQLLKRDASSFEIEEAHVHIIRIDRVLEPY